MNRLWDKIDVDSESGCWMWTGATRSGYGAFWVPEGAGDRRGRVVRAHRHMYEAVIGPVPAGLELDHLCQRKACVNPAHLEPVTHLENILRQPRVSGPRPPRVPRTHCRNGLHELTPENARYKHGWRLCRPCIRATKRRARDRRRMEAA